MLRFCALASVLCLTTVVRADEATPLVVWTDFETHASHVDASLLACALHADAVIDGVRRPVELKAYEDKTLLCMAGEHRSDAVGVTLRMPSEGDARPNRMVLELAVPVEAAATTRHDYELLLRATTLQLRERTDPPSTSDEGVRVVLKDGKLLRHERLVCVAPCEARVLPADDYVVDYERLAQSIVLRRDSFVWARQAPKRNVAGAIMLGVTVVTGALVGGLAATIQCYPALESLSTPAEMVCLAPVLEILNAVVSAAGIVSSLALLASTSKTLIRVEPTGLGGRLTIRF